MPTHYLRLQCQRPLLCVDLMAAGVLLSLIPPAARFPPFVVYFVEVRIGGSPLGPVEVSLCSDDGLLFASWS